MTERAGAAEQGPTEEQLHKFWAFERFTMAHPRLMHVHDRLMNAIHSAVPGSLVLVIGPTGVGKTTLRLKSEQVLTAEMMAMLRDDPGRHNLGLFGLTYSQSISLFVFVFCIAWLILLRLRPALPQPPPGPASLQPPPEAQSTAKQS